MKKQPFIIPDSNAFIQLAQRSSLSILPMLGRLVITDAIDLEVTGLLDKDYAKDIAWWSSATMITSKNNNVDYESTMIGKILGENRVRDSKFKMKNAGENSIAEWLSKNQSRTGCEFLVITDDAKAKAMLTQRFLNKPVHIIGAFNALHRAQNLGLLKNAQATWSKVVPPMRSNPWNKGGLS